MTEKDYITGDLWAALDESCHLIIREDVDLTPSPDAAAQVQAIGIVLRQQAIRKIIDDNNLQSKADWTGYDG